MKDIAPHILALIGGIVFGLMIPRPAVAPTSEALLRIHVNNKEEAMRLSRDDELGYHFDCLEYIPAESVLQSCEEE